MKEKVTLFYLFKLFAKMGVMTFGGGLTMLPILTLELCEKRNWVTTEEIADYFAIGQCTPGIIAVNTATFVGRKMRGIPGGIAATLGVVFPSVVIITLFSGILSQLSDNLYLQKAFLGIRVCVCILILNTILKLRKKSIPDHITLIVFLLAVLCAAFLKISPALIVIIALFISVLSGIFFSELIIRGDP